MDYKISIPKYVQNILSLLNAGGFEAFVVGGCLRDTLMNKTPADWDVCTIATPDQIMDVFKEVMPVIPTGIKHGTITVLSDSMPIEVTTYRTDGEYLDNRHPKKVEFINNIQGDLSRRDFTINAMAYNPSVGLVDAFGGINDIKNKIIRTVGNPCERFHEDALRILRALRFAAVCDFSIEEETASAIHSLASLLDGISAERKLSELKRLLLAKNPSRIIKEYIDVFSLIIPNLTDSKYLEMLDILPVDPTLRMAALLGGFSKLEINHILNSLKCENSLKSRVSLICENYQNPPATKIETKEFLRRYGAQNAKMILTFGHYKGVVFEHDPSAFENALSFIENILENNECYSLDTLSISGNDLINIGFPAGKQVGEILNKLLFDVINEKLENSKEALQIAAKNLLNNF